MLNTHGELVLGAKNWLETNGYTAEDVPKIGDFIADAYGTMTYVGSDGETYCQECLMKVETSDSLLKLHAKTQMISFAAWSAEYPTRKTVLITRYDVNTDPKTILVNYDQYLMS